MSDDSVADGLHFRAGRSNITIFGVSGHVRTARSYMIETELVEGTPVTDELCQLIETAREQDTLKTAAFVVMSKRTAVGFYLEGHLPTSRLARCSSGIDYMDLKKFLIDGHTVTLRIVDEEGPACYLADPEGLSMR